MGLVERIKSWFGGNNCKYDLNVLEKHICIKDDVATAIKRQKQNKTTEYYSKFCNYAPKSPQVPIEIRHIVVNGVANDYVACKFNPANKNSGYAGKK